MVLTPKEKGDYQGIGLVEVTWKVVAVILNRRLTSTRRSSDLGSSDANQMTRDRKSVV